ncbi:ABC transporter permease [Streptomyces heilongjiangensis]|uniref:ABC transporter permease n=1 Tax=Streptomyces heilongjiangensis TaxID=945052 RepID=A0ABW1BKF0_9ACTN|nr:ABC transporter permease [Streptomyces heilongjiangensis]MDC2952458.1 ABC transporter permease [Streptomyces heilongjiangensis]
MSVEETTTATTAVAQEKTGPAGGERPGRRDDAGDERLRPVVQLARTMILSTVRDKGTVFFLLIFPILFLLLFGSLFKTTGTSHIKVAQVGEVRVLDELSGEQREQVTKAATITRVDNEKDALQRVREGDYDAMVKQDGTTVVLRYSAADSVKGASARAALNAVLEQANLAATGQPATYALEARQVEDESVKPIQYLTPGLLGWAIASSSVFSAALTLVTLRRRKILQRMRLSPIRSWEVVAARVAMTMLMVLVQTALFLLVATLPYFGLQLTGNWWLVVPLVMIGTLPLMALGLLIGSVTQTEESAGGLAQLLVLPMSFLSGSFFTLDGAPDWVQAVSYLMPLRYLVKGSEEVLSRGGGLADVLPTMGGMLLFTAVVVALTLRLFKWNER